MTFSVQHKELTFRGDTGEAVALFYITISGAQQATFAKKVTVRGPVILAESRPDKPVVNAMRLIATTIRYNPA